MHLQSLDTDLDISNDLIAAIEPEEARVDTEIEELEISISNLRRKLDALWADAGAYEYELVSVFMHRGKSYSGLQLASSVVDHHR